MIGKELDGAQKTVVVASRPRRQKQRRQEKPHDAEAERAAESKKYIVTKKWLFFAA
jgi:hypothetical protein